MGFEILIMLLMDVTYFGDSGGEGNSIYKLKWTYKPGKLI